MKIAFLVGNSLNNGGAERVTVSLANEMSAIGHELFLLTGSKGSKEYELNSRIKRFIVFYGNIINNSLRIARIVKKYNIDVVIGMGLFANFSACILKLLVKAKIIISERNDPVNDLISKKSRLLRYLIYPLADGYVFQTNKAKEFYPKYIQDKSVVIHNPVKLGLPLKTNVNHNEIIAVGRLNKQKNYPLLLNAFKFVHEKYPEYILRIFGLGEELDNLKQLANDLNIDGFVKFEGFNTNVHEAIKDSQIFIMTSDFEGMPNSLMEAMAMGFPVVSTECPSGGPSELIINGYNGLLIPTNDQEKMESAILTLIADKNLRKDIGKRAMNLKLDHSVSKISFLWLKFIRRLTNNL